MAQRIAALPMYAYPDLRGAHESFWTALADHLRAAGVADVPGELTWDLPYTATWTHPGLLLGQACEYPLTHSYAGAVRVVATPCYTAAGCERNRYRSAIVVRADDPVGDLAGLRQRRCAYNDDESNSGMNLLRAAVSRVAGGAPYFAGVRISGAHAHSARLVVDGEADVAALDCVSYAHLRRNEPQLMARLRILAWTPAAPALPYVTAATTDDATLAALRAALVAVTTAEATRGICQALLLDGVDTHPDDSFGETTALEREAIQAGYPRLR